MEKQELKVISLVYVDLRTIFLFMLCKLNFSDLVGILYMGPCTWAKVKVSDIDHS